MPQNNGRIPRRNIVKWRPVENRSSSSHSRRTGTCPAHRNIRQEGRICASDKCRRTPATAGWLRQAADGIQPVFSALAGGNWEPDIVAPKRAVKVTQCASDRCRRTLAAAGWLWLAVTGSQPVFSAFAWRCEPEWLASVSDSGALAKLLLRWLTWWMLVVAGGVDLLLCCYLDVSVIVTVAAIPEGTLLYVCR